jgi:uncharacterized protein (TIGR03435 family)
MRIGHPLIFLTGAFMLTPVHPTAAQSSIEKTQPMAKNASPSFLVATIKPSDPNETRDGFPLDGRHLACVNETVDTILTVAYGIHVKQIVNAPEWLSKDRFDITGVADTPGVPNLEQQQQMWRKLLADRFHLILHRETRELAVYAVRIAKSPPMLKVADPGKAMNTGNSTSGGQRTLKFRNMSMAGFILNMNWYLDRPIVDQTSLPGNYDFTLKWTFDDTAPPDPDAPPSLFTAIKEQLGLKLDAVKGPAEVLVIDHIEQPSAN